MRNVVVASATRTAIGRFGGSLSGHSSVDLGEVVLREAVDRAGLRPEDVQEVILGNVIQAGSGQNVARQALIRAGIPVSVPGYTVNKVCASGMKAVALAALSIASGEQDIVIAGGVESMSNAPFLLKKARRGYHLGEGLLHDSILTDALSDPLSGDHMGATAENLADEFAISREDQDCFALRSHQRAIHAIEKRHFEGEIVPVPLPQREGPATLFRTDEYPRVDTSLEALSRLKPAFREGGSVTAGNSSGINDGAAALVIMSEDAAKERGLQPLARIVAFASAALEPERMGLGPVGASRSALERGGLQLSDIDVIELNEAFAAQSLAVIRELNLDPEKVNPGGGAIALGHPVGASGARVIVTLAYAMERLEKNLGLATLCVGGGQGMALILERWRKMNG